jgi:hypothetical protein
MLKPATRLPRNRLEGMEENMSKLPGLPNLMLKILVGEPSLI